MSGRLPATKDFTHPLPDTVPKARMSSPPFRTVAVPSQRPTAARTARLVTSSRLGGLPLVTAVAAVALSVQGCAGTTQAKEPETTYLTANDSTEAELYMPLEDGTVYTYDTRVGDSPQVGLMTIQVKRGRGGHVELEMAGRTEHLKVQPGGVAYLDGGYMLRAPLSAGNAWEGKMGVTKVVGVHEKIDVPAGHFAGCVRTIERGHAGRLQLAVTSVYCPRVGLVSLETEGRTTGRETAVLRSYGPRADSLMTGPLAFR